MTSKLNPWTLARLTEYLGRDEHTTLEFKSCKVFDDKNFPNQLIKEIDAFVNTDGGLLIVGIEEVPSVVNPAIKIAGKIEGVLRTKMNANRLSQIIYSKISPSAGSLIQVFPVIVSNSSEADEKLAFVIEVNAGHTAYQSLDDKIYYGRRGTESIALDDKDIRLRMITDDKSRVELTFRSSIRIPNLNDWEAYEQQFLDRQKHELKAQENKIITDSLSDEERKVKVEDFLEKLSTGSALKSSYVEIPRRVNEARVCIDILARNAGNSKVDRLCMSFSQQKLKPWGWSEGRNVRTNTFDEQVYLEKDFTINDGISLYPGMTLSLLSFILELKRDGPVPTFPSNLEFHVFLDGGIGSVLLIELAQIAEKYALEFEQKASAIEARFPHIKLEVR